MNNIYYTVNTIGRINVCHVRFFKTTGLNFFFKILSVKFSLLCCVNVVLKVWSGTNTTWFGKDHDLAYMVSSSQTQLQNVGTSRLKMATHCPNDSSKIPETSHFCCHKTRHLVKNTSFGLEMVWNSGLSPASLVLLKTKSAIIHACKDNT